MYHIQFVSGTNRQTGHLSERIRILSKPARGETSLTYGWSVSDSELMDEEQVRALMTESGIDYPTDIPIVNGDYSTNDPGWNATYWHWGSRPDKGLPIWMQPHWWLIANWNAFPDDPYGEDRSLCEWLDQFLTIEDIAKQFNITPRRARAIAKNRHERFGIGWQVPGTKQWLFRPEELDQLKPEEKYRK